GKIAPLHGTFRQTDKRLGAIGALLLTKPQLALRLADPGLAQERQPQPEASAEVLGALLEHGAEIRHRIGKLPRIHVEETALHARLDFIRPELQPAREIGLGFGRALLLQAAVGQGLDDLEIVRMLLQDYLQGAFGVGEIPSRVEQTELAATFLFWQAKFIGQTKLHVGLTELPQV